MFKMNLLIILFITAASCVVLPSFDHDYEILSKRLVLYDRAKRDVNIHKNSDDKYSVKFNKAFVNDDKSLSISGILDGVDRNGYDSIKTGLDFKNSQGDNLGLSALQSKDTLKVSGQGDLNIFKTDTQSLGAKAFGEKDFLSLNPLYKYGGNLNYMNKNGNSLSLSALNMNEDSKYSALGNLNLLNTDTQSLDLGAFGERNSHTNKLHSKFGGSLDYINKKGHNLFLKAREDSDLGKDFSAKGKYTIFDNPNYNINAQGYWEKNIPKVSAPIESYGASLNYLNGKGDIASLLAKHTPNTGDELTASGKYNVFHSDNQNLDLSGKFSRIFPSNPNIGSYNSYSANMDYLYKNKLSANLGVDHSGLLDRTDISALGKLKLINDKNTHLDIFGGVKQSMSPKFDSGLQPNFGLELETSF